MNLADKTRRLLCAGKLFCQSDSLFERKGRFELFVLLFDNYRQSGSLLPNPRPRPLSAILRSGDGKARGEETRHQVSCSQTGENPCRPFSVSVLPILLIYVTANTLGPFETREI